SYTYTDARQPDGTREFRRTPHSGRADVRYLFNEGKGTVSFGVVANGRTPDVVFANPSYARSRLELDGYWLVQAAASYKVAPNVEIYGRIENMLNQKYQEIYGYSAARLGAYAGVKINFDTAPSGAPK
ncbi:MAG: TonB-dependent receptor, partial [Hyphomicrobiaceae bacterium]|nr:TonB-dependent receptor [Hyphomicrobiaceae bacterium]